MNIFLIAAMGILYIVQLIFVMYYGYKAKESGTHSDRYVLSLFMSMFFCLCYLLLFIFSATIDILSKM